MPKFSSLVNDPTTGDALWNGAKPEFENILTDMGKELFGVGYKLNESIHWIDFENGVSTDGVKNIAVIHNNLWIGFAVCKGSPYKFICFCTFVTEAYAIPFNDVSSAETVLENVIKGYVQRYGNQWFK